MPDKKKRKLRKKANRRKLGRVIESDGHHKHEKQSKKK
jgi:hypothetical protein